MSPTNKLLHQASRSTLLTGSITSALTPGPSPAAAAARVSRSCAPAARRLLHASPRRPSQQQQRTISPSLVADITHKESELTHQPAPVRDGPTAQAQRHAREPLTPAAVADIARGEAAVTEHDGGPVAGGPAATAQSELAAQQQQQQQQQQTHTGTLDAATIARITHAEAELTGQPEPVKGGPTAQAQRHAGEPAASGAALHDITEGEKMVTGAPAPVKGGPTATAQSEVAQSRS